ncbi:MAG: glycosyltransferase family 39 protein, partial [Acidimicrobiales bacterium]
MGIASPTDTGTGCASPIGVVWSLVAPIASAKVAFQLFTADLYGAHRDEFYYLESGHHLAWGYVDNPPLVPFLYRLSEEVFGHSVPALAVVPALLGGVFVILGALIAADLGGGRAAQVLTALLAWLGPIFLTTSHFLSTVSLDLVCWSLASWLVLRMVRSGDTRLWLAVGVVCGIGLLNKDTMAFWAIAAGLGLLCTPQRALLASRWAGAGAVIALVIFLPNLAWEASHHWATLEFLGNLRRNNSSTDLVQFAPLQLAIVTIAGTAVWVVALRALGRRAEWRSQRWLAYGFAVAFVVLFALGGKAYYLGSWYLPLVAMGAVVIERYWSRRNRRFLAVAIVATGLLTAPLFTPILPANVAVAAGFDTANKDLGGMLGWPHVVDQIASVVHGLPAGEGRTAVIFTEDYSEAGAVDFYGPGRGLPSAISGHNTFWLWGYGHPVPGAVVVAVGLPSSFVHRYWSSVTQVATLGTSGPPIDPQERGVPIWLCRDQRTSWASLWPAAKHYE